MRNFSALIFIVATGFVFICSNVPSVKAQDTSNYEFTLEEITVTAQKREENQQKVPIAMEVLTGDALKEQGKTNLDEILSSISSVGISKSDDGYRVSIRGVDDYVGTNNTMSITTPSVAVNKDGVTSSRYDNTNLYDVERVEVLYGPQSTLYSSTSPGGIVNVTTADPKTDKFEGSTTLTLGNYHLVQIEGMLNIPLSETLALRAAYSSTMRDGYLDTGSDDENQKSVRLKTLYRPNDSFSFLAGVEYTKDKSAGFAGGSVVFVDQDDVDDPWTGNVRGSLGSNDQNRIKIYGRIEMDFSFGSMTVIPSYSKGDGNNSIKNVNMDGTVDATEWEQESDEKGLEVRMASAEDFFFKWILGATYYKSYSDNYTASEEFIETGVGSWSWRRMMQNNKAIYGNITYPFTEKFRVTGGLRGSWDELDSPNWMWTQYPMSGGYWPDYGLWATRNHMVNDGMFDRKLGFEYDLGTNSMIYADYSTSYRVQGGQPGGEWPPEKLTAYTLGSKNRFIGNKLQVNAATFYYDYKDFFARTGNWTVPFDTDGDGVDDTWIEEPNSCNFGDGRMMGFDLQTNTIITQHDLLNLSISYLKTEWTDLYLDFLYDWYTPDEDYNGKPMKNSPPWTISISYSHVFTLANGGTVNTRVDSRFRTAYKLTYRESEYPNNYQETFHIEDVNVVYSDPQGKWSFTAYSKNIFNYAEKKRYTNNSLSIGDPRTYGCILSLKF